MTRDLRDSVRALSREYVMRQVQELGRSSTIPKRDLDRAIDKVSKAILEVKAAQRGAMKK